MIPNEQLTILSHPKFNYYKNYNDIALIKLKKSVNFSKTIYPIRLPFEKSIIPENLTLTGWVKKNNTIHNPVLKEDVIPIFSVEDCIQKTSREFKDQIVFASFQKKTVPNQFCGGFNGEKLF